MAGGIGSSGRALAQQTQGPEFKPQYWKKKDVYILHIRTLSGR
jgi:hypothetical protein